MTGANTYDCKEFVNEIFNDFLKLDDIKRYIHYPDRGAVFAEWFKRTVRKFLKIFVFEKDNANWVGELPSVMKTYSNTIYHSLKLTTIDASKRKMKMKYIKIYRTKKKNENQNTK